MRKPEFLIYPQVTSTNDLAKKLAQEGAAHGGAVLAYAQTAGRGRRGRTFASPKGGIYLSVILRPRDPLPKLLHLTPVLAVAACDAIEEVAGIRPKCKWVNDLLLEGRKLAGILVEISGDALIAGIGVNVARSDLPEELRKIAVSLAEVGAACEKEPLARAIASHMARACETAVSAQKAWMDRYRADCATIGQMVSASGVSGIAKTVADNGALIIETETGDVSVQTGEVSCNPAADLI
ncbi:MAG: biotin--[Oscillospiraceae bacterium]|nr:biotin--[acetyl-CoA-carboxylase] ligase [Oscillospiraceae bacterium]